MSQKLFLVECRGMKSGVGSSCAHGKAYIVARDAGKAYQKLREHLDKESLGFAHERELETITLLAEEYQYPNCDIRLFLSLEKYSDEVEKVPNKETSDED